MTRKECKKLQKTSEDYKRYRDVLAEGQHDETSGATKTMKR